MKIDQKIVQMGYTSLGILIPKIYRDYLGIKKDDLVVIEEDQGKHGRFIAIWKKEV